MPNFPKSVRAFAVALSLLAATALTGCGAGGSGDGDSGAVKLGIIPIIDVAPVKLGVERGLFAAEGLEVTTQDAQGGAAIVPGVMSGDFDFGYSNLASLLVAREQGLPLKLVAIGARASDDILDDGSGQLMVSDPSIRTVADLKGKTVGINTLKGISEVAVRAGLEKGGLAPGDVTLVEMPIPNMVAGLESGQIAGAMVGEPFITIAEKAGARPLPVGYAAMGEGIPFAGWFASEKMLAERPDVVERFTTALEKSFEYAAAHPDEVRRSLNTYLTLDAGIAESVRLPVWGPAVDRNELDGLATLTAEAGLIGDPAVLDGLIVK
ncbi:ABC transporter substrate-binding protein [Nocardia rhamnosiphila]|uniref:ABC transporter substrate-binding protein n=1 Tax=Nocardia rhamnosiphila TaxID=426716 RepID=UPI003407C9C9